MVHASGRNRSCSTVTSSKLLRTMSSLDVPATHTSTNDSSALMSAVVILDLGRNQQDLAGSQTARIIELVHLGQRPPGAGRAKLLSGDQVDRVARLDHAHTASTSRARGRILAAAGRIHL